ncbi:MAG: 2-hydroxyacyl-CoA dehydratase subunit D [Thermodesulfobacteriota bacterium]
MNYPLIFKKILRDIKEKGPESPRNPLLGWTCTYLPIEILEGAELTPYRILPEATTEKADSYLDPNFCPFIKAILEKALSGGYSFLNGIIILNTCDGMRRLFDAWRFYCNPPFSYFIDLPRVVTPSSIAFFGEELRNLINQLNLHFDRKFQEEKLLVAIERSNRTRTLINELFASQGRGDPPLRHGDILEIISERWEVDRKLFNQALECFLNKLGDNRYDYPKHPRLMVTGSLLEGSTLINLIEELGGEVVMSDLCTAQRDLMNICLGSDLLISLSKAYLEKPPCARMYDTEQRIKSLKKRLVESKAQGLIYFSLKFCDPYLYELPAVEDAVKGIGVHFLHIEGEYREKLSGNIRTRIQAFIEVLKENEK